MCLSMAAVGFDSSLLKIAGGRTLSVPQIVILGRPNVGKTSLFNWLTKRRNGVAAAPGTEQPESVSVMVQVNDQFLEITDADGICAGKGTAISPENSHRIDAAIERADVILFVVDAQAGLTPRDHQLGRRLRYTKKPIICVANKCDEPQIDARATQFQKLGRGRIVCVSTTQNRNRAELMRLLVQRTIASETNHQPPPASLKLSIVGRPNAGRRTLIDALCRLGDTSDHVQPGPNGDAVDVQFTFDGVTFRILDSSREQAADANPQEVEFCSLARCERQVARADVVVMMIDATQGISNIEKQLASSIAVQYKPCMFVINKWDRMLPNSSFKYAGALADQLPVMPFAPNVFTAASEGKNVKPVLIVAQQLVHQFAQRVPHAKLNRIIQQAVAANPPARINDQTGQIFQAVQIATCPPTIVLECNAPEFFDTDYHGYLLATMHTQLPFPEVPVKLYLRQQKVPIPPASEPELSEANYGAIALS